MKLKQSPMKVYRVYNGWMGNGPVYRIVAARTRVEAVELAEKAGMKINHKVCEAEVVLDLADGPSCEESDYD